MHDCMPFLQTAAKLSKYYLLHEIMSVQQAQQFAPEAAPGPEVEPPDVDVENMSKEDMQMAVAKSYADAVTEKTFASFSGPIRQVGTGIMYAVVVLIVLGALYNTDIVSDPENPNTWTNLTDTFAEYGETAFIMIGVGFIALGAAVALNYMGAFGREGGR